MASNRFSMQPKQVGLSMSPSYSHTVNGALPDDEDDGDICPVCDGECTCSSTKLPLRPPSPPTVAAPTSAGPLSMEELSRQYSTATSISTPSSSILPSKQPKKPPPPPSYPSLKIKLAIPPNLLAKRQSAPESSSSSSSGHKKFKNPEQTTYVDGSVGENFAFIGPSSSSGGAATPTPSSFHRNPPAPSNPSTAPRKRGRPRKIVPAVRDPSIDSTRRESTSPVHRRTNPKTNIVGRPKQQIYAQKYAKTLKARPPVAIKGLKKKKIPPPKRRRRIDSDASLSELSDDDDYGMPPRAYYPDSEGDRELVQFPTFVSASALSSMESGADGNSSDSSSSLSSFDDSDLELEEEAFMRSEMQEKGRRKDSNNEWVIRNRRKSAGPSDAEMDSDATEDEDDEEPEEGMQADVEGDGQDEDDGDQTDVPSSGPRDFSLKGLVTGWSDEESDFDADVFFANLSSDTEQSSDDEAKESGGRLGDDDDETSSDVSTEAELMHMREELENLPLELAESWDGQLMFTNGTLGGQAIIDIDFEVNASQFVADSDTCCKNGLCGSPNHDHYMASDGEDSDVEMSVDDGGYEEDAGEGEGDTTDEELVGEDDLPNERAMRLFNFPLSVSAINPLSTVSPAVTPVSKRPGPHLFTMTNRLESPSPADILAGKHGWDSADEMDELFDSEQRGRRRDGFKSEGDSSRFIGPRKGVFTPAQETRQVVIDDSHKEIPSPHPRFNRRRARRFNTVEALLRKHLAAIARHPTTFASTSTAAPDSSPLKLLPSVEINHDGASSAGLLSEGAQQHADDSLTTPIDLDDVFESSFFNPDPNEGPSNSAKLSASSSADAPPESATTADESDSNRNEELKHLHRWDVISVGAFRQTRENVGAAGILDSPGAPGWPATDHRRTPASSTDYGNVLKASPLSAMLWPSSDKNGKKTSRSRRGTLAGAATSALAASPLILPTAGADDGDRTPTKSVQTPQQQQLQLQQQLFQQPNDQQQQQQKYAPKTRKELRKERKSNKKYGHSPHGNHHPSHHYHSHHHHPNTKSRSSGSAQRTNFFLSSVPPLNI